MVNVTTKVSSKGQVVLPKVFREEYGMRPGQRVVIKEQNGKIVIEKPTLSIKQFLEDTAKKYGKKGYVYSSAEYENAMERGSK